MAHFDTKNPVIIGGTYVHVKTLKVRYIIAACVIEGEDYVELTDISPKCWKDRKFGFSEKWYGSLKEFDREWSLYEENYNES